MFFNIAEVNQCNENGMQITMCVINAIAQLARPGCVSAVSQFCTYAPDEGLYTGAELNILQSLLIHSATKICSKSIYLSILCRCSHLPWLPHTKIL